MGFLSPKRGGRHLPVENLVAILLYNPFYHVIIGIENGGNMGRILILREKHGDRYFDVPDDEVLHKTCVKILKERLDEGWYGPFYTAPTLDKNVPPLAELNAMEECPVKTAFVEIYKKHKREMRYYTDEQAFLQELALAFNMEYDPEAKRAVRQWAFGILESRDGGEYEGVWLEETERVDG